MYCAACGNELSDPQQFCPKCGVPVVTTSETLNPRVEPALTAKPAQVESLAIEAKALVDSLVEPLACGEQILFDQIEEPFKSQWQAARAARPLDARDSARLKTENHIIRLMILMFACNGPVTVQEALFFLPIYKKLKSDILTDASPPTLTIQFIESLAKISGFSAPYTREQTWDHLETYDAKNGSHFSEKLRDFVVRLTTAAASVDGPPSAKAIRELARIKTILQQEPHVLAKRFILQQHLTALLKAQTAAKDDLTAALQAQAAEIHVAAATATDKNDRESLIHDFKAFEELTSPTVNAFLQKTKLIERDGQPSNCKNFVDILHADLAYLISSLTKVDGQVSDNRARIFLRLWTTLDKQDLSSHLKGELLETVKRGVQQQWVQSTGPNVQLTTIVVLQMIDGMSLYSQQAKSLFLRLATLLTNADGSASAQSQCVFQEFEKLLAPPDVSVRFIDWIERPI